MASYEISLHPLEKIYIKNDTTTKVCYVDDESSLMIVVDDLDKMMATKMVVVMTITMMVVAGLHNLCHPTIRDGSTWRAWRCFPVLQLRFALILRELNQIFMACLFKGSQEQSFFLQTLLFTAFLVTALKF